MITTNLKNNYINLFSLFFLRKKKDHCPVFKLPASTDWFICEDLLPFCFACLCVCVCAPYTYSVLFMTYCFEFCSVHMACYVPLCSSDDAVLQKFGQ